MSSITPVPKSTQKHRACDECRLKKLACSKESDGCSRCKKEDIACVYSEQKKMGRPRKRKCVEQLVDESPEQPVPQVGEPDLADFDFSLLDMDFGVFNDEFLADDQFFGDSNDYGQNVPFYTPNLEPGLSDPAKIYGEFGLLDEAVTVNQCGDVTVCSFGINAYATMDFGVTSSEQNPSSNSNGNLSVAQSLATNPPSTAPLHSEGKATEANATEPTECSCLSSLYLALSSLQILPSSITAAFRTIREASYTAKQVLHCQICGNCPITEYSPPMKAMQNTMLIGTLLPVIAENYKKLLKSIDERYEAAIQNKSKIWFKPIEYMTSKTIIGESIMKPCLDWEREVEPADWRSVVRGILRADVYGYENGDEGGLQGIIREVEARQRKRHDELDRLTREGLRPLVEGKLCVGERKVDDRTCERILDVARIAMEGLVIA